MHRTARLVYEGAFLSDRNTVDLSRQAFNTDTNLLSTQTIDDMSALLMGMTETQTKTMQYTLKTESMSETAQWTPSK